MSFPVPPAILQGLSSTLAQSSLGGIIGGAAGSWIGNQVFAQAPPGCTRALLQGIAHAIRYQCGLGVEPGADGKLGIVVREQIVSVAPVYVSIIVFATIGIVLGWLVGVAWKARETTQTTPAESNTPGDGNS